MTVPHVTSFLPPRGAQSSSRRLGEAEMTAKRLLEIRDLHDGTASRMCCTA